MAMVQMMSLKLAIAAIFPNTTYRYLTAGDKWFMRDRMPNKAGMELIKEPKLRLVFTPTKFRTSGMFTVLIM